MTFRFFFHLSCYITLFIWLTCGMRVCKCVSVCAHARVWSPKISWTTDFFFKTIWFLFFLQQKFFTSRTTKVNRAGAEEWIRCKFSFVSTSCFQLFEEITATERFSRRFSTLPSPPPPLNPQKNSLKLFPFSDQNIPSPPFGFKCVFAIFLRWVRRAHGLFVALDEIRSVDLNLNKLKCSNQFISKFNENVSSDSGR